MLKLVSFHIQAHFNAFLQILEYFSQISLITLYNMHKPRVDVEISSSLSFANDNDDEISTSPRGLGILYKTLIARKLSKPDDGRYRPKHVVFHC